MGTRNMTIVVKDKEVKVAQYGQWDGYPSGQGATILNFLTTKYDRNLFLHALANTYTPTEDQIKAMYQSVGIDPTGEWIQWDESKRFSKKYPSMDRDLGGDILELIQSSLDPVPVKTDIEFVSDSLMCEWVYVLDLDSNELEVYKGFNKSPLAETDRFFSVPLPATSREFPNDDGSTYRYYQVRMVAKFPISELPTEEDFITACEPPNEEE